MSDQELKDFGYYDPQGDCPGCETKRPLNPSWYQPMVEGPEDDPNHIPYGYGGASNNWVIGGNHTKSGGAIVVNDPHMQNQMPALWHTTSLNWGEGWIAGASMAGTGLYISGRTNHLGWGVTVSVTDSLDYYEEDVQDGKYRRGDEWIPIEKSTFTLKVKGVGEVTKELWKTDKGPIFVSPDMSKHAKLGYKAPSIIPQGTWLSMSWTGFREEDNLAGDMLSYYDSSSVEQGVESVSAMGGMALNYVMGNQAGDIGYALSGSMPRRANKFIGQRITQAWTGENGQP